MTRFRSPQTLAAFLLICLCACSQDGFMTGIDYVNQPSGKDAYSVARYSLPDHILVRPIAGIQRDVSDTLAELTAEHLARREFIATVTAPPQKTSRLTGWATPADTQTQTPAHIEYRLIYPDGQLRLHIDIPVDPLLFRYAEMTGMERRSLLKRIASDTADRFYAILTESKLRAQEQERTAQREAGITGQEKQMLLNPTGATLKGPIDEIFVMPALGAPGDGLSSLKTAMAETLKTYGVPVVDRPSGETMQLQCIVALSELGSAQQTIRVSWELKSKTGEVVVTVDQNNAIESGSLNGAWGDTAHLVASAAAEGLVRALNNRQSSSGE